MAVRVVRLGTPRAAGEEVPRRDGGPRAASRTLDLLAALSQTADFSVGCYCEEEARCHRAMLRELLAARGAKMA